MVPQGMIGFYHGGVRMSEFEPGVATIVGDTQVPVNRILGRNPGPMTGPGTNSYLIGANRLCLLDPGPKDEAQFESFISAIGDRQLEFILLTHAHGDHSPGAARLKEATGAKLVGLPVPQSTGQDKNFSPDGEWKDNDVVDCGESWRRSRCCLPEIMFCKEQHRSFCPLTEIWVITLTHCVDYRL
jgi:glyoxylase-like metal-dependent hydrolase (beta-lactamase superfamily II)